MPDQPEVLIPPATPPEPTTIQMTQAKLDEIIQERVTRAVSKYGDYDQVKTELGELKKSQESELERQVREAREAAMAEVPNRVAQATTAAKSALISTELKSQAILLGFKYPEDVVSLLANHKDLEVKDDFTIKGAEKLVKDLAEKRPEWLATTQSRFNGAPPRNGTTPPGGNQQESDEQLAERARHRRQIIGVNGTVF